MRKIEMLGRCFGRAIVLLEEERRNKRRMFTCLCDCGKIFSALGENLRSGHTNSCGCYMKDQISAALTTHGASKDKKSMLHSTWSIWLAMKQRCLNPNNSRFSSYGGRGISVCERWLDFENFLNDMGEIPTNEHSIERYDNDEGYEPSNCGWATREEQANNKRTNIRVSFGGEDKTLAQWSKELNINYGTLITRYRAGWSAKDMLLRPVRTYISEEK